ncbi:hypothetical protein Tco_0096689 [Tanacetum coccineum]
MLNSKSEKRRTPPSGLALLKYRTINIKPTVPQGIPLGYAFSYLSLKGKAAEWFDRIPPPLKSRHGISSCHDSLTTSFRSVTEVEGWVSIEEYVPIPDGYMGIDMSLTMNVLPLRKQSIPTVLVDGLKGLATKSPYPRNYLFLEVGLKKNHYTFCDYCRGSYETDECKQTNLAKQIRQLHPRTHFPRLYHVQRLTNLIPEGEIEKERHEGEEPSIMQEPAPQPSIFYQPSKSSNLPFPSRLKKQKNDDEDEQILSIFKQIHINMSFLEAMIHMPKGAKVLKDFLSHKEKLENAASSVKLSEECSAIIQRNLPQKEGSKGASLQKLSMSYQTLAVKNRPC